MLRFQSARARAAVGLLVLAVAGAADAQAQGATISGRVTSETGEPLLGANVTIDALSVSVGTNAEGRYTITLPAARVQNQSVVLRARAIGFAPQTRTLTLSAGAQTVDLTLKVDINRLNQVVVTGVTGATETKKLPFTVAQVSEKDMPVPGANPLAQIQGKVPGAQIVSATGRPGSQPAIILRGPQSINAAGRGQGPLIIVDGVILNGTLADINPQDIENVEVVKGAAASSLYGSRAGNGVIQITTRSGKNSSEGIRFNSRMEYGVTDIEREYKYPFTHFMLMNETMDRFCIVVAGQPDCSRTVDIEAETYRINDQGGDFALPPVNFVNDGGIALNPGAQRLRSLYQTNRFPRTYNPIQQFVTNGENWNLTFDMTGRIARTNFFASANQFRQEGSVRFLNGYTRNSLRLNVDQQLGSDVNVSVRTFYTTAEDYNLGVSWFGLSRQPANATLLRRDSKGRLFIRSVPQAQGAQNVNPAYAAENFFAVNEINRFVGAVVARWAPLSWMDGEMQFGYDQRNNYARDQRDRGYRTTALSQVNLGDLNHSNNQSFGMNFSTNVTMRRDWLANALSTRLNLRYLYEQQDDKGANLFGANLAVPGLRDADAAIQNFAIGSYIESARQIGMFAALDLEYKERYIVGALFRRDGSSLFGRANRWQNYGRGSFAWRLSEESWFGFEPVSDLKLRYSVGQAGNRPRWSAQYETFTIGTGGVLNPQQLGNANLRPEVSTEIEYGIDLEIQNRYGLTLTYADNRIDGQILPVPPPASAGFGTQWKNVGELHNKTIEASLNVPVITRRDLQYSFRLLYDRVTSRISRLDVPEFFYSGGGLQGAETMFKISQGGKFGEIYGRRFITSCSELPGDFRAQCGPGRAFQKNSDGFIVWTGEGNTPQDGITKNLWFTSLAAGAAPWGQPLNWGMPIRLRDERGAIPLVPLGNALPDFRWSVSQNFSWKKFTAYALVDATVGKEVYNRGRQWSLGDFMHRTTDQTGKSVALAKPIGYYFRASPAEGSSGIGGLYDVLGPNNLTVEDASFVKVREVSLGYRLGRLPGVGGDWNVSLIGRNLRTWTGYSDFDPEVGAGGGNLNSAVLNAIDGATFPNLRTFSFQIGTSF